MYRSVRSVFIVHRCTFLIDLYISLSIPDANCSLQQLSNCHDDNVLDDQVKIKQNIYNALFESKGRQENHVTRIWVATRKGYKSVAYSPVCCLCKL